MASKWDSLQAAFLKEHQATGITAKAWCEREGLKYQTARRYIKPLKQGSNKSYDALSAQSDTAQSAHTAQPQTAHTAQKPTLSIVKDSSVEDSEQPKPLAKPQRQSSGKFAKGNSLGGNHNPPAKPFQPGNDLATKHSGYARRLDDDGAVYDAKMACLDDEIIICRARAMIAMDTHKRVQKELESCDSLEGRIDLYKLYVSTEQALDRNIGRIESLTRTKAQVNKLKLEAEKLAAESAGLGTEIGDVVAEIQEMGSDGLMSNAG